MSCVRNVAAESWYGVAQRGESRAPVEWSAAAAVPERAAAAAVAEGADAVAERDVAG